MSEQVYDGLDWNKEYWILYNFVELIHFHYITDEEEDDSIRRDQRGRTLSLFVCMNWARGGERRYVCSPLWLRYQVYKQESKDKKKSTNNLDCKGYPSTGPMSFDRRFFGYVILGPGVRVGRDTSGRWRRVTGLGSPSVSRSLG